MAKTDLVARLVGVLGREKILTDKEDLMCYAYDATADMPRRLPDVMVSPRTTGEVAEVVKLAGEFNVPVYPRGSATNLSGGTIPGSGGIVLSTLEMNKILEVDPENLTATVQPGVIIQDLNDAVAPYGLIYPPDPGSVTTATMGGSVAECSGGLRGLKYGVTKHYVMGLEVVLANGKVIRAGGKTVKNVTAYDLVKLFTGSEGTLGIITEITVKLIPAPEARRSMLAVFDDMDGAARTITGIISNKVIPATLEIMDNTTIRTVVNYARVGLPVDAAAVLLIEVDGIPEVVAKEAEVVARVCRENGGALQVAQDDTERDRVWTARRAALPALAQLSPTTIVEDATVPRSRIPEMLKALQEIAARHRLTIGTYGHAGDGNLHPTIVTDERNPDEMERVHRAVDEIFETAIRLGGTLSGEHGIGIAKKKYLEWELGPDGVEVLQRIKSALDPAGILNPGKIVG
ncbi:FAD-binding protein [Clostridiales bacterium PH28_bin88]|nr:FAD-binding protein [Clostridiales bacterium PH28_bin88]